jgi:hypothetical protein
VGFVIVAPEIGLRRRKFHHAFLRIMRNSVVPLHGEARRITVNIAKLPELLRKSRPANSDNDRVSWA